MALTSGYMTGPETRTVLTRMFGMDTEAARLAMTSALNAAPSWETVSMRTGRPVKVSPVSICYYAATSEQSIYMVKYGKTEVKGA